MWYDISEFTLWGAGIKVVSIDEVYKDINDYTFSPMWIEKTSITSIHRDIKDYCEKQCLIFGCDKDCILRTNLRFIFFHLKNPKSLIYEKEKQLLKNKNHKRSY